MSRDRLRILFVVSEVAPLAKTGGLADVAAALPKALVALGHDVRVCLPKYRGVEATATPLRVVAPRLAVPIGDRVVEGAALEGRLAPGIPVYLVARDEYYDRPGLYGTAEGSFPDNCERFTFLSRAVLELLGQLDWTPQVVHCHDWQTGLVPVYLETLYRDEPALRDVATLFTIHNLAYQGNFWHYDLPMTGLGWDLFTPAGIEFYGDLSLLKGGLVFADLLTTVSPTYAREIQTPEYGERLDGVLRERSADLVGILNGLDYETWDPATDPEILKPFGPGDLDGKAVCAAGLREELGLAAPGRRRGPLCAVVSRLAAQKGLDLVADAVPALVEAGGQLVLLGSGEEALERRFADLARTYPAAVAVRHGFQDGLAHRIYAGADVFLMPSRYEPCGLGQLIALRYGALPVVRRTGGLADTVRDAGGGGAGTGFVFDRPTGEACREALRRALAAHADPVLWRRLVTNAMSEDFSWEASAELYVNSYRKAIKKARRHA